MPRRETLNEREAARFQTAVDANPPLAASGTPEEVIPRPVMEALFGGLLACTPRIWKAYVQVLVDKYGTDFEATSDYAKVVRAECIKAMGPSEDW